MARVHTIGDSTPPRKKRKKKAGGLGQAEGTCKTFTNRRNGCKYTICKKGRRWVIQPGPSCPTKKG